VVGRWQLPPSVKATQASYGLHPSVLDSALQAAIGLAWGDAPAHPAVPFALERLRQSQPLPEAGWVVIRARAAQSELQRLDAELCTEAGECCVRLEGFALRAMTRSRSESSSVALLTPQWEAKPLESTPAETWAERWIYVEAAYKEYVGALALRS